MMPETIARWMCCCDDGEAKCVAPQLTCNTNTFSDEFSYTVDGAESATLVKTCHHYAGNTTTETPIVLSNGSASATITMEPFCVYCVEAASGECKSECCSDQGILEPCECYDSDNIKIPMPSIMATASGPQTPQPLNILPLGFTPNQCAAPASCPSAPPSVVVECNYYWFGATGYTYVCSTGMQGEIDWYYVTSLHLRFDYVGGGAYEIVATLTGEAYRHDPANILPHAPGVAAALGSVVVETYSLTLIDGQCPTTSDLLLVSRTQDNTGENGCDVTAMTISVVLL